MRASTSNSSRPSGGKVTSSSRRLPPLTRTVRFRLTVWYSSLLLVFGTALVVSLNIAARLDQPDGVFLKTGAHVAADIALVPVRQPNGTAALEPQVTLKDVQ